MTDFAFRSKSDQKQAKGKLEVRAKQDTPIGSSDRVVPKGSVGYASRGAKPGEMHVFWPSIPKEDKYDWRSGVHDSSHLEPTGKRG